ncbi:hypothetical protein EON63_20360 [archaeon]|nr:MAG: hypothetical protein EON63_20360 [archaeon]
MQRKRHTYTDEDQFTRDVEALEEQRGKLKSRMLGNIRFVGELYKKVSGAYTIHMCFNIFTHIYTCTCSHTCADVPFLWSVENVEY